MGKMCIAVNSKHHKTPWHGDLGSALVLTGSHSKAGLVSPWGQTASRYSPEKQRVTMLRNSKARVKNGQCHRAFLEPAGHDRNHVNGLPATQSQSEFLRYKNPPKIMQHSKRWNKSKKVKFALDLLIKIFTVQFEQVGCLGFGKYTKIELSKRQELPFVSANWRAKNVILRFSKTWVDPIQNLKNPLNDTEVKDKALQTAYHPQASLSHCS